MDLEQQSKYQHKREDDMKANHIRLEKEKNDLLSRFEQ